MKPVESGLGREQDIGTPGDRQEDQHHPGWFLQQAEGHALCLQCSSPSVSALNHGLTSPCSCFKSSPLQVPTSYVFSPQKRGEGISSLLSSNMVSVEP